MQVQGSQAQAWLFIAMGFLVTASFIGRNGSRGITRSGDLWNFAFNQAHQHTSASADRIGLVIRNGHVGHEENLSLADVKIKPELG